MSIFKTKQKSKENADKKNTAQEPKTTTDEKLFEIAIKSPLLSERKAAVEKLSDETLLLQAVIVNGDINALKKIDDPDKLLYIAVNECGEISKAAYERLKGTVTSNELKLMIEKKLEAAACKNMMFLVQAIKDVCPKSWKGYIKESTIEALLDLRYWKDISKTAQFFWELYLDADIRKKFLNAEERYQKSMQQWEGEYNHIAELILYMINKQHDKEAVKLALELYNIEGYKEYFDKKNIKESIGNC